MTQPASGLASADLGVLADRGITEREALRQLELLRSPPPAVRLLRPATVGDGIELLDPNAASARETAFSKAVGGNRLCRFVPASGAASRMFADLESLLVDASAPRASLEPALVERFRSGLGRWAFSTLPEATPADQGPLGSPERALLESWLSPGGLARQAKGLLPFHRTAEGSATAVEEHLIEAAALAGASGSVRAHFTVSPDHRPRFASSLERFTTTIGRSTGSELSYELSEQDPSTETLALDDTGGPARDESGQLVLRPGGHGSLLGNLERTSGDLVLIKNIDNILPQDRQQESIEITRHLVGHAALVQERLKKAIGLLRAQPSSTETLDRAGLLARELSLSPSGAETTGDWLEHFNRPLRICGVVRNEGEPGGGPFWVARHGPRLQIVESAQVNGSDPAQESIAGAATHFNPVLLVCALRDVDGTPFELRRYVDPTTSFVSTKMDRDRVLTVLEHPGLWNGAMADWITLFVEIPVSVFAPVKTVWDLLSPPHVGPRG